MCRRFVGVSLLLLTVGLAQAKEVVWQKAVYSDARYATAWQGNSDATRDALVAAGYALLNADQLKTWMTARIADKAFSVVVFCRDSAPDTVTETMTSSCTLRKYLDAGGKIVWYGDIPFYYQSNASATNTTWGNNGAPAILGFDTSSAPRDSGNTSIITPLGTAWGLTTTWTTQRPALPTVTTDFEILAKDNAGNACAWVKHYVPNDTFRGFVRFRDTGGQAVVADIIRVAEYVAVKAWNPQPANGAVAVTMPLLQWNAGPFALYHDVYFGTNPNPGAAEHIGKQVAQVSMYYHVAGLTPGTTYYWRIDEIDADGTVFQGDVWSFTAAPVAAWAPAPGDAAAYVASNAVLSWTAGMGATTHDVYFGSDRTAVESGAAEAQKATKQPTTTYTPAGLEAGKTYYWRVDEVQPSGTKVTGPVWSFTVRPVIAKSDPSLVGWWKMDDEKSNVAVDYSGYDNYGTLMGGPKFVEGYLGDALSFDGADDFVNCGVSDSVNKVDSVSVAAWIKVNVLGRDHKIASNQSGTGYKMGVYTNNMVEFEIRNATNQATLNRTAPGGTVLQAGVWYHVVGVYEKGKAIRTYVNGKLDRELATAEVVGTSPGALMLGREAQAGAYWWNGLMDDVRVYSKALTSEEIQKVMQGDPLLAWDPQPASNASVDIRSATSLNWMAGEQAAKHDVYFGKDKDAVKMADATAPLYQGRQTGTNFSLDGKVEFGGGSYFWRIDEVEADETKIHKGVVWSFSIPGYLIVDEFENYTDEEGSRIYETWIDGWTNGTGSVAGNTTAPFAERTIIHGGKQAMPMDYNNVKTPFYSEVEQTFSPLQDWTGSGVTDLSLWFRGNPARFVDKGNGAFTVGASGHDIWDAADDFRFVYKQLNGDGSITVKVDGLVNTNAWAKAGVMIRQDLTDGSAMVDMIISFSSGAGLQWRPTAGAGAVNTNAPTVTGIAAPQWVKLTRKGNAFTAQYSADGKTWLDVKNPALTGTPVSITVNMTSTVYIGLCTTSHNTAAATTAEYSGVATTGNVTGQWQVAWIGDDPDRTNSTAPLYAVIEDSAGKSVVVTHPDPAAVNLAAWTQWKIPLSSLTGVNPAKVKKLYLGVGDRKNPAADGFGRLYIDDIQVIK